MKKTIILNESTFKKMVSLINEVELDANMRNAHDRLKRYQKYDDNFYKNSSLSDDVKNNNFTTYQIAMDGEINDIFELACTVYEKISHNMKSVFANATNKDPRLGEKPTQGTKWCHPAEYYLESDINKISAKNRDDLFYKAQCYYVLVKRVYAGGEALWSNMFFNPKYRMAKVMFLKCRLIADGTTPRVCVGVPDENGEYPEGSMNWVRARKRNGGEALTQDFQPSTFGQTQYKPFVPSKEQDTIIQWFQKAKTNPKMYEKYILPELSEPETNGDGFDINSFNF